MEGITEHKTPQGVHVLRIHYTADTEKRTPEFEAEARRGMSEQDFEREYNINFNAPRGKPWYPEFQYNLHVAKEPIKPIPGRPICRAWDYGLTPATSFGQVSPKGQLLILHPEMQSEGVGITAHGKVVKSESQVWFPGFSFSDVGDPAGNARTQTDEKSCNDILRAEYEINVMAGEVTLTKRDEALRKLLITLTPDGEPMLLIDPRCEQYIIGGFRGGYQRKEVAGIFTEEPADNMFTHIMDTIQYMAAFIFGVTNAKPFENRLQGGISNDIRGRTESSTGYRRGYQTR
jgi:hypothetical protein